MNTGSAGHLSTIYSRFTEWCIGYMRNPDTDPDGITVFIHPGYSIALLASKGPGQQKERLSAVFALCGRSGEYTLKDLDDIQVEGTYIGTALLRYTGRKRSLSDRYISAINTFHRPDEPLVRTLDESFIIAKLLEYKLYPGGSIGFPDILPDGETVSSCLPPALQRLNTWLGRIVSGGSSTASLSDSDSELVIAVQSPEDFAAEFIAVTRDTQELWFKRPRRPEELLAQLKRMTDEEILDAPDDISDGVAVLGMGKRESEAYFRDRRENKEDNAFDPLNTLVMTQDQDDRNDLANNRFGMDPFRMMNVNEIFFHSTIIADP